VFKVGRNGKRFYAVYAEHGPYRDVFEAIFEAARLNSIRDSAKTGKLADLDQAQGSSPVNGKTHLVQ
jgi:hypothetical protein